jgi:hypothetical protein
MHEGRVADVCLPIGEGEEERLEERVQVRRVPAQRLEVDPREQPERLTERRVTWLHGPQAQTRASIDRDSAACSTEKQARSS